MNRSEAKKFIAFLEENILTPAYSGSNSGVFNMAITKVEEGKYKVDQGNEFKAYWCPYKSDSVNYNGGDCTLAAQADYMFTAKMNGCSFGIGTPGKDGSVRVAHANTTEHEELDGVMEETFKMLKPPSQKNSAYNNQIMESRKFVTGAKKQELQLQQLKAHLSQGGDKMSNHISRAAYNGCKSITTFGLRVDGKWEFWFQGVDNKGVLIGCFPFPKVNPG